MNDSRFARWARAMIGAAVLLPAAMAVQAQNSNCGPLENHYGPFDYRTQRDRLAIVERYHFTPNIEALSRGATTTRAAGDISYLMRTSPNHHRGLVSLVRLAERENSPQPRGLEYSVDCYFERAIRFRRDDVIVRMLFARYLHKQRRTPEALQQLETASQLAAESAHSHYNVGLIYFEVGEYDLALAQAHRAMSLGFDQPELAKLLKGKNKWKDPVS